MTAREQRTPGLRSIAIALANAANAQLLEDLLGQQFCLHNGLPDPNEDLGSAADLIVIDVASLHRNFERIRRLRRLADPVILPVLLVADSRSRPHPQIAAELGKSVDDILRIPTSQAELKARIDNLLRLRALSREQDDARHKLVGVVGSLRTLNACDRVVVRSTTEQELLNALCRAIVHEGDYSLAWTGFSAGQNDERVEIRACAGTAADAVMNVELDWGGKLAAAGMVGRTIGGQETQVVVDTSNEPALPHLQEWAQEHGLAAVITLPLTTETGPPGCLAIYSNKPGQFGREERQLLERLAGNLVFGLNALRIQRDREEQAAEIHYLAYTDVLTGLPNRRHLIHYLDGMLADTDARETCGAIMFIDLDGFKLINDALGHEVGDQVLKQIGQRLRTAVRDSDLVARQGGDEFLVVMVDAPRHGGSSPAPVVLDNAHTLAERIIAHLSEPLMAGGYAHCLKASVGISLCPDHGRDAVVLIENADKAMYEAKRSGGGRSRLFSEDISTSRQERFSMERRLRQALEEEQFELHYQPIFELDSCRVVAAEALIRWPQRDGSLLMPGAFMPLAEETGLINPLGDWVLATAARQLRTWHDRGMTLSMAVNLSMKQLYPDGDAEHLAALVRPHIDPCWIHLEVTENALMTDPAAIENLLAELHDKGFQLAIDDFGTGYSSLSRLQHLSIQSLKIDRSFVRELGRPGSKGAALVAIIQQMASSLDLQTIAEGIETDEQRQLLCENSNGTGWGQGFWFSKAIPADDFERQLWDK